MSLSLHTPAEVASGLASRVRASRLMRGWTQAELSRRAGVALSTLKMFEHQGHISLERLLRIASALDDLESFQKLFEPPPARSLDELEARSTVVARKYGRSAARSGTDTRSESVRPVAGVPVAANQKSVSKRHGTS